VTGAICTQEFTHRTPHFHAARLQRQPVEARCEVLDASAGLLAAQRGPQECAAAAACWGVHVCVDRAGAEGGGAGAREECPPEREEEGVWEHGYGLGGAYWRVVVVYVEFDGLVHVR
jgi:hypothetical protein